ncbi:MAG: hypothetical protein JOZ55_05390 [Alphaproteobacteria bacterium]|nr:hypothetical protein [Alphaproteobacteria bacterium]
MTPKLSKLAAVAAVLFTVAGSALPASADSYTVRDGRDHVKIVRVSNARDGERYGPPRIDREREMAWRDMHLRHFHHHHRLERRGYDMGYQR